MSKYIDNKPLKAQNKANKGQEYKEWVQTKENKKTAKKVGIFKQCSRKVRLYVFISIFLVLSLAFSTEWFTNGRAWGISMWFNNLQFWKYNVLYLDAIKQGAIGLFISTFIFWSGALVCTLYGVLYVYKSDKMEVVLYQLLIKELQKNWEEDKNVIKVRTYQTFTQTQIYHELTSTFVGKRRERLSLSDNKVLSELDVLYIIRLEPIIKSQES